MTIAPSTHWRSARQSVMEGFAVLSPCGLYRYELRRIWSEAPLLTVCMLNPSTADHANDDPTILTLIHFAKAWGYGGLYVVNLYALRTSSPAAMMASAERVGPKNDGYIADALFYARETRGHLLAAWGNHGAFEGRSEHFERRALKHEVTLVCLGRTLSGAPKHPMARGQHRIPRDQLPIVWRPA